MEQLVDESIQEHFQVLITNYNKGPEDQERTFIVQANLGMDILPGASDSLGAGRQAGLLREHFFFTGTNPRTLIGSTCR